MIALVAPVSALGEYFYDENHHDHHFDDDHYDASQCSRWLSFFDDYHYDDHHSGDQFCDDNHPASAPGGYSFMMIITMMTVNLMIRFIMIIIQPVLQVIILF